MESETRSLSAVATSGVSRNSAGISVREKMVAFEYFELLLLEAFSDAMLVGNAVERNEG